MGAQQGILTLTRRYHLNAPAAATMVAFKYSFIDMGSVADPAPHRICLDVGNRLARGVIDHHQPDAPENCTAGLVLDHADDIRAQARALGPDATLEIVTHRDPDMDGITAAYFVEHLIAGDLPRPAADLWAESVCAMDRGHTRLDPESPVTPYSVFSTCIDLAEPEAEGGDPDGASRAALEAGKQVVGWIIARLAEGLPMESLDSALQSDPRFAQAVRHIRADLVRYRRDLVRAEKMIVGLPRSDESGIEEVPGLWIDRPEAGLFKAWARGDAIGAGDPRGFVFTAVGLTPSRFILSVQPDLGLWLKGLGDALEAAESEKRRRLGRELGGDPRPGYASPDPWYDERSDVPGRGYTIVDSPRGGTVLDAAEVRAVFERWTSGLARS